MSDCSHSLAADIASVSGVGPKRAAALRRRNINNLHDALTYLPHRYEDLRQRDSIAELRPGTHAVLEGVLHNVVLRPMRGMRWRRMVTGLLRQGSRSVIRVVWFNLHDGTMPVGEPLVLCGRVTAAADGSLELVHPEIHRLGAALAIRPIYAVPAEVPQRVFASIVDRALEAAGRAGPGAIPPDLRIREKQPSLADALRYVHQPPADANLEELRAATTPAHRALALDEMFAFQLALARERTRLRSRAGAELSGPKYLTSQLMAALPFVPTASQLHAIDEISADLAGPCQMNRILVGDVGSGKTLIAFHAALRAAESGWQAAIMAPTELLAEQHFANFNRLCARLGFTTALLTGKVAGAERARLLRALQRGQVAVVFGTHALIQQDVAMSRLGLAVIDEQHRFGVFDRARLIALGSQANVLLMTATPIPRSLALILFRNLSVSTLEQMPTGRAPISTEVFAEEALEQVDAMVRAELEAGHRAYYVLPLIEGEQDDPDSVVATARRLGDGPLREFRIGALHGRMRPAEKDCTMRKFRDGLIEVLVSTTVVEVGIDVPQATMMVIVAADRYGLAQLHQLRGRVGRGTEPSRCLLVMSNQSSEQTLSRVQALCNHPNGADIAELDLRLRGPGNLFGARQTGALPLRFGRLISDLALIEQAGDMAEQWLRHDPELSTKASAGAKAAVAAMLDFGFSLGDVG